MSKKSCIDCKYYYEGQTYYDYYNGCSLLEIEYFNPDGNIIEEELEKKL